MTIEISNTAVAGAGAMGSGIAQMLAQSGINVVLFDISRGQIETAKSSIRQNLETAVAKNKLTAAGLEEALKRISFSTEIESLKGDLIIEAIVEKLEAKRDLFDKVSSINPEETILASNTSSIPITRIAQGLKNPQRVAGMHFFNPAHIMKLVEIISGAETSGDTAESLKQLALRLGKTPVLCTDSPGFIVNRVARHYYVESLQILEENVAGIESIDALMESAGFKMGPFKLMDFVGNDINFAVTNSLYESFHHDAKFRPSRIQQQKVDAGYFGKKTGKGFYEYEK